MTHSLLRYLLAAATALAFAVPATAQLVANLAVANGTHTWGAPYWTENVPDTNAEAGVVDHLNNVFWLDIRSPEVVLLPGTYVAQMKVAKMASTAGRFDLSIQARAGATVLATTNLAAASQTVDTYVWSPELIFTVQQPTPVLIAARNVTNSQNKQNYRFDTARIGFVPSGRVVHHESMDLWNVQGWQTAIDHYVAEPSAVYGRVAQRNSNHLAWFCHRTMLLPAGTHVANARFRNLLGPAVAHAAVEILLSAQDDSNLTWLGDSAVPAAQQQAGIWVHTPDVVFTLPAATMVRFAFALNAPGVGYGYQLDSFALRQVAPSFSTYGDSCGGLTLAQTVGGQVGTSMTFEIGNGGSSLVGLFAFGSPVPSIPLDFLGATGCLLHVTPDVLLSGVFAAGACSASIAVPNLPSMFGVTLDLQGASLDPTAPGALKFANAGQAYIGR